MDCVLIFLDSIDKIICHTDSKFASLSGSCKILSNMIFEVKWKDEMNEPENIVISIKEHE